MGFDIRDNLKSIFDSENYNRSAVARKADMFPSQLCEVLNKRRKLEANEFFRICEAINRSPNDVRNYDDHKEAG